MVADFCLVFPDPPSKSEIQGIPQYQQNSAFSSKLQIQNVGKKKKLKRNRVDTKSGVGRKKKKIGPQQHPPARAAGGHGSLTSSVKSPKSESQS